MHGRKRATNKPELRGLTNQQLQLLGITEEMTNQEQTELIKNIEMNTANKPPEKNFSKQQQEIISITNKLTEQQQNELLGVIKMYLSMNQA